MATRGAADRMESRADDASAGQPFMGVAVVEAAAGGAFFCLLHLFGLGGDAPLWLLAAASLFFLLCQVGPVNSLLRRSAWQRRVELPIALSTSGVAVLTFGSGWGSLMVAGMLVQVIADVRQSGSSVWRASLFWCVVTSTVGQVLVGTHVAGTNLQEGVAHGAFASGLVSLVIFSRMYGTTTERLEQEIVARGAAEARFRSLVQNSSDLVVLLDADGAYTYVSPAAHRVLGYSPEWLVENGWRDLMHQEDLDIADEALGMLEEAGSAAVVEVRARHADGTWRWWEVTATNRLHDPAVAAIVCNVRDATERKTFQERLSYQATRDTLTGLVNRPTFLEALESALGRARRNHHVTAVLFLDLDGFKAVNDSWGHHAGDVMLKTVARRVQGAVRPGDTVGRFAGDEFTVLLEDLGEPSEAYAVAARIELALQSPVVLEGHPLLPTASVGVAVTIQAVESADDLIRSADLQMYKVKQARTRPTALPRQRDAKHDMSVESSS